MIVFKLKFRNWIGLISNMDLTYIHRIRAIILSKNQNKTIYIL